MRANACQVESMATSASAVRPSASPIFLYPRPHPAKYGAAPHAVPAWPS